jgi:uncharacterized membrane protein YdjX (TVP38/TMEM64 family)
MAMLAVSIVPVAPFIAVGAAAGAMRVAFLPYVAGVLIGHVPGTLTTSLIGHQVKFVLEGTAELNHWLVAGAIASFIVIVLVVRRWLRGQYRRVEQESAG